MAQRDLTVRILGDSTSLERAFARSSKSAQGFQTQIVGVGGKADKTFGNLRNLGGAFAGGLVAQAAISKLKEAVDVSSSLSEQISKSRAIFGDSSTAVEDWAKTTASSIGIAQDQALEATGTFGNLFNTVGIGASKGAEMSRTLVQIAADLASFNDASPEDTLNAIRSGLVGEAEPLRRYGVLLSEVRVQQVALAETGKTNVKALTNQEKAAARYAIILRDTQTAQGDFERTSGGLANQQRTLAAQTRDLAGKLGSALKPAVQEVTKELITAEGVALKLSGALGALASIEIPAIHIPFVIDISSGTVFEALAGGRDILGTGGVSKLAKFIGGKAKETSSAIAGAINKAFPDSILKLPTIEPKTDPAADKKQADAYQKWLNEGIGSPLKRLKLPDPAPLVTGLSNLLKGALLDAQIKTPTNFADDLSVLLKQKDILVEALADPRLKPGGDKLLSLKSDLASVVSAIDNTNGQIAAAGEALKDRNKALADAAAQAHSDAFAQFIAGLELKVDRAGLTRQLSDDVEHLTDLEAGLRKQIAAGVDVSAAQSRLLTVVAQIADKQDEIKQRAKAAAQASQFKALGLTATGDQVIPGVENLRKQLSSLTERLSGSIADTGKNRGILARIRKVLTDPISTATEETRAKIRDMFQTIRGEFDKESNKGPLTKTTGLNASKVLAGLGLGRDQEKELRARLSSFNSAGIALAGMTRPTGSFASQMPVTATAGGSPIIIKVDLDGRTVAETAAPHVLAWQQRYSRRNPRQKRGPNSGV